MAAVKLRLFLFFPKTQEVHWCKDFQPFLTHNFQNFFGQRNFETNLNFFWFDDSLWKIKRVQTWILSDYHRQIIIWQNKPTSSGRPPLVFSSSCLKWHGLKDFANNSYMQRQPRKVCVLRIGAKSWPRQVQPCWLIIMPLSTDVLFFHICAWQLGSG